MNLGPTEMIVILVIMLLLFGGAQLPKLARSIGQAQSELKAAQSEFQDAAATPRASDTL